MRWVEVVMSVVVGVVVRVVVGVVVLMMPPSTPRHGDRQEEEM